MGYHISMESSHRGGFNDDLLMVDRGGPEYVFLHERKMCNLKREFIFQHELAQFCPAETQTAGFEDAT